LLEYSGAIIFTFVITFSVALALTFMIGWQLYLVLSAQTTIEFYSNRFKDKDAKTKKEKRGQMNTIWELAKTFNCSLVLLEGIGLHRYFQLLNHLLETV